jgi:hypothetical protein
MTTLLGIGRCPGVYRHHGGEPISSGLGYGTVFEIIP